MNQHVILKTMKAKILNKKIKFAYEYVNFGKKLRK